MRHALLVAALAACAGCTSVARCKSSTLLVDVTLAGAAAQATSLAVTVAVAGGASQSSSVPHKPGVASGTLEVDFSSGYPLGKAVAVRIGAEAGGAIVGSGSGSVTLGSGCSTLAVDVAPGAGGGDLAGTIADLAGTPPPPDFAGADLSQRAQDLAGSGCVPKPENCFNGIDDDCNGYIDCADSACGPVAQCVPQATAGFSYGTLLGGNLGCPQAGASATPLYNNFSDNGPYCNGCSCGTSNSDCTNTLEVDSPSTCSDKIPSPQYTVLQGVCQGVTGGTRYISGTCSCAPPVTCTNQGSASLPAAGYTADQFCASAAVGAGCGSGMVCAPRVGSNKACIMSASGTCPGTYGTSSSWNTAYSDGRTCGSCTGCYIPPNAHCYINLKGEANCPSTDNYPMNEGQNLCPSINTYVSAEVSLGQCIGAAAPLMGHVTGGGSSMLVCCQ
jgi:hypothetical protein